MKNVLRPCRLIAGAILITLGLLASPQQGQSAELKLLGHYDLNIGFANGTGWQFNLFDFSDDSRIDPRTIDLGVTEIGKKSVPMDPGFAPLGVPAGATYWELPQPNTPGIIFLGYRTDDVDPDPFLPFFGSPFISLEMTAVRGSGVDRGGFFSMFQTDAFGTPTFQYTAADGIGNNDVQSPIPLPAHAHFNWAFTQPGEYQVTFRTEAELTEPGNEGVITNGVGTFTFFVPGQPNLHILDAGEVDLEIGFDGANWLGVEALNASAGVASVENILLFGDAAAKTTLPANAQFSGLGAAGSDFWVLPQTEIAGVPSVGLDGDGVGAGVFQNDEFFLELQAVNAANGGHVSLFQTDGFGVHTVLADSSDGVDPASDRLPGMAGGHSHHSWGFSGAGLYTLTFTLSGTPAGGGAEVRSDPFTVRVGIEAFPGFRDDDGNGMDDHWEARHGFTAPADPAADPDSDNRSTLREYLHDTLHDSGDADVTRLRISSVSTGSVGLEFDTLEGRQYQVFYSEDLVTWRPATSKILGGRAAFPMIDDGTGLTSTPPSGKRFYRLDISAPR
jgi:surface-anchored protein